MRQRRTPQRKEATGFRKIFVLVVLLILIVVCMRQLSDPERMAPALEAIGLVPHSLTQKNLEEVLAAADAELIQNDRAVQTQFLLSNVWLTSIQNLPSDRFRDLTILCFQANPLNTSTNAASTSQQSVLEELYEAVDDRLAEQTQSPNQGPSDQALDAFKTLWLPFRGVSTNELPAGPLLQSLRSAIDRRLLDSFEDNTAWHADESISLGRALQKETQLKVLLDANREPSSVPILNTFIQQRPLIPLPLLTSKTSNVRGRLVRVRGRVLQADPSVIVKRSALGAYTYRVVWISPEYSGNTLACLYCPAELGQPVELDVDAEPLIEFTAVPIKRLAYESQSGTNTATVLVAINHHTVLESTSTTSQPEPSELVDAVSHIDLNLVLHIK